MSRGTPGDKINKEAEEKTAAAAPSAPALLENKDKKAQSVQKSKPVANDAKQNSQT